MSQNQYRRQRAQSWRKAGTVLWDGQLYIVSDMPNWMIDLLLDTAA